MNEACTIPAGTATPPKVRSQAAQASAITVQA